MDNTRRPSGALWFEDGSLSYGHLEGVIDNEYACQQDSAWALNKAGNFTNLWGW